MVQWLTAYIPIIQPACSLGMIFGINWFGLGEIPSWYIKFGECNCHSYWLNQFLLLKTNCLQVNVLFLQTEFNALEMISIFVSSQVVILINFTRMSMICCYHMCFFQDMYSIIRVTSRREVATSSIPICFHYIPFISQYTTNLVG